MVSYMPSTEKNIEPPYDIISQKVLGAIWQQIAYTDFFLYVRDSDLSQLWMRLIWHMGLLSVYEAST